jgi:type VI secretion system protein ImpA
MTAQWESQELLQPITADQPCGENLEDTQLLASFDAFRLFGQATRLDAPLDKAAVERGEKPRAPIEWGEIKSRALGALNRSKDLRLLAHLGTAFLRTDGLVAFSRTLQVASHWLQTYWVGAYPLVDEDAMLRRNALNCFADPMAVIDSLRRLPLVKSRQHGSFSLRDIDIASGQMQPADGDSRPEENRIAAAFAEAPLDELQALQQSVAAAIDAVKQIEATMSAEGGTEAAPEFDPLSTQLVKIDRVLRTHLASRAESGVVGDAAAGEVAGSNGQLAAVGAIKSRQDAIRALDAVAEFFRRNEPSSPIPLLLDRAKRLVSKSFLEVLADIAPDAVMQARSAGGLSQDLSGE